MQNDSNVRKILVLDTAGEDARPKEPPAGQIRLVTDPARILELLREAARSRPARLAPEAGGSGVAVLLGAVASERDTHSALRGNLGGPGFSERHPESLILVARAPADVLAQRAWRAGEGVTVWLGGPSCVLGFRCRLQGTSPERLFLGLPRKLARYSRRGAPRIVVPEGGPRVVLPLADGSWLREARLRDLSPRGMAVDMPSDVGCPLGGVTRIALRLRDDTVLSLAIAIRNERPGEPGRTVYGMQFLGAPRTAELAIQRYLDQLGARVAAQAVASGRGR